MAPRVSKKDREELPKPIVQVGTLGVYPLTNLAVSYLYNDYADVLLGIKDHKSTLALKGKPQISVLEPGKKKAVPFEIKGRFFNGFSDSFYRGKLPNVVICLMDATHLEYFAEEFLNHMEKMFSLGFFLKKVNPVDELVPCFLIVSNGIFFDNLIKKLTLALESFNGVDERLLQQILGKLCRGVLEGYGKNYTTGSVFDIETPSPIRLAGGNGSTQIVIQSILSAHRVVSTTEKTSANPVERLELLNAYRRIAFSVLPSLLESKHLNKSEIKQIKLTLEEVIFKIGLDRKAFESHETPKKVLKNSDLTHESNEILPSDSFTLKTLGAMATYYKMASAQTIFKRISTQVEMLLKDQAHSVE